MIAKLTTGNGFSGTLKYDLRDGQLVEKRGAVPDHVRVLDAKDVCFDYDDEGNMVLDVKQVAWDFRQQAMAYGGRNPIEKPVYHWALAYHPNDQISDEQMLEDTKEFLDKMGFGNTQYVVIAHHDTDHPHVHVIANIVDNDGKRIPTYKMIDKAHKEAARITKDRGYTWGESANKETLAHKPHEKVRILIKPLIKAAVAESSSFEQLQMKLEKHGISCVIKQAADGKRGGISFGYEYDGQQHTFKGSAVDRKLSYGHINLEFANKSLIYLVHSRTDATVYYQPGGDYRKLEPLRKALVNRGYMVAMQAEATYERDMRMHEKYPDYRTGTITLDDGKIIFGKEKIFGNPKRTEPAFAQQEQSQHLKPPTPAPESTPAPEPVNIGGVIKAALKNKSKRAEGEENKKKKGRGVRQK